MTAHPQEIPAIFVDDELLGGTYHYYKGSSPYQGQKVTTKTKPDAGNLLFPGLKGSASLPRWAEGLEGMHEHWMSVCNPNGRDCMTIATFSDEVLAIDRAHHYVTLKGHFALTPGLRKSWVVYLFPYRFNAVIGGKTVRGWIRELAANRGLL